MTEPIQNLFKDSDKSYDYVDLEDGEHICGLVEIKNIQHKRIWQGEIAEQGPGYQITFRSKQIPEGFVNVRLFAKTDPRSMMYKLMARMLGKEFTKVSETYTSEQFFQAFISCVGRWYRVETSQSPSKKYGIWVNANIETIKHLPELDSELGDCRVWFEKNAEAPPPPAPPPTQAELEKKSVEQAMGDDNLPEFDDSDIPF